jgi:hypothetical protein
MRRGILSGLILLIFVGLFLVSYKGGGMPREFPAPDFSLNDIFSENIIELTAYSERPVLLYFFASW